MLECVVPCNLSHRRDVAALCILFKIYFLEDHPLGKFLPLVFVPVRATRRVDALHQHALVPTRCRTAVLVTSHVRSSLPVRSCGMPLMVLCLLVMMLTTLNNLLIGIFFFEGGFCFLLFFFSPFLRWPGCAKICRSHGAFALSSRSALPLYFNINNII